MKAISTITNTVAEFEHVGTFAFDTHCDDLVKTSMFLYNKITEKAEFITGLEDIFFYDTILDRSAIITEVGGMKEKVTTEELTAKEWLMALNLKFGRAPNIEAFKNRDNYASHIAVDIVCTAYRYFRNAEQNNSS